MVGAYDPPPKRWMPGHRGVDLVAAPGQEILAPASGVVSFSGKVVDREVLTITTEDGYRISFEPVADPLPRGSPVTRGQPVARRHEDRPHEPCGTCLHLGVRSGEDYLNPLLFLMDLQPSVLWPIPDPV